MVSMDRPCEADREKLSDPCRVALESLAWRLRFIRAGGIPTVKADNPANAVKAVRQATWRISA